MLTNSNSNSGSTLYNIFSRAGVDISSETEVVDLLDPLPDKVEPVPEKHRLLSPQHGPIFGSFSIALNIIILGSLGIAYFSLLEFIHTESNSELLPSFDDYRILFIFKDLMNLLQTKYSLDVLSEVQLDYVNKFIYGVLLGLVDPLLLDVLVKPLVSKSSYETTNVIRSLVAILGIAYGLKKIEWENSLELSLSWSMLNPCLWFVLDGTIYVFVVYSTISILFVILSFYYDKGFFLQHMETFDRTNKLLWIGSAAFVGLLVFGKVGRFLFSKS